MECSSFRRQLPPYLEESLDDATRARVRDHLATCADCRSWAVAEDPTLLLVASQPAETSPVEVDNCARAVMAQVRQRRLERRLGGRRRPWLAAAAVAVMAVGAGVVWRAGSPGTDPVAGVDATGPTTVAAEPGPPPRVEVDMPGADVRVYQWAESDDSDTAVYHIVNPALDS